MRLGIDLGTTRTVVAAADRGNYPIVSFTSPAGDLVDHYPSIVAEQDGQLVHGLRAQEAAQNGAPSLRSFKRLFGPRQPGDPVTVGGVHTSLLELAAGFIQSLHRDLATASNLPQPLGELPEAVISVPANAHSGQRFLTMEAFRRAGFVVQAMINEPSAAGLEYAHRHGRTFTSRREHVVVYDLGGGTFDSALVRMSGERHDVQFTSGVGRLGGDDFDEALLALALERAGIDPPLEASTRAALALECRTVKEGIHPNTRRVVLDLAALGDGAPAEPVVITVADYYERVRPLVERTLAALGPVLERAARAEPAVSRGGQPGKVANVAGIYVVGGGSGLPVVPRVLRERFGRRVHRSVYPSAATAIGLAIAALERSATRLSVTERFTRHLGVFRERNAGAGIAFDGIFARGTAMPQPGEPPLVATRVYRAMHNIGVFRFVECGSLDDAAEPCGDITPHGRVCFPFAPHLRDSGPLEGVAVERLGRPGPTIEERYEVDAGGIIAVTITDLDSQYGERFVL